jgi:hypothetical protein
MREPVTTTVSTACAVLVMLKAVAVAAPTNSAIFRLFLL